MKSGNGNYVSWVAHLPLLSIDPLMSTIITTSFGPLEAATYLLKREVIRLSVVRQKIMTTAVALVRHTFTDPCHNPDLRSWDTVRRSGRLRTRVQLFFQPVDEFRSTGIFRYCAYIADIYYRQVRGGVYRTQNISERDVMLSLTLQNMLGGRRRRRLVERQSKARVGGASDQNRPTYTTLGNIVVQAMRKSLTRQWGYAPN